MIGRSISHYKILEKLGEGGMGVVYKAQDTKLDRTVALKFLPSEYTRDPDAKQRFIHEAKAASALDHPNICTIYEISETQDGQLFIAMAYYEGETLHQKISGKGEVTSPLRMDDAIAYALQAAEGLQAAHEKGIVHRDIKSSNLMVTTKGQVKIMDFGLAKTTAATMLTKTGATVGTVPYMSPEQARGEKVDHRTDIWSFGAVMYEMVTGHMPFKGEYHDAMVYLILNENPQPVTALRAGVPMELERIIGKCLEKKPADRYQHMDDIIVDLRKVKAVSGETERKPPRLGRIKWSKWFTVGAAAAIITLFLFLFFPFSKSPDLAIHSIAVLPFANTTGDPNTEYLSDGIAESIISSLSQLSQLRVMARSTVFSYKGKDVDPRKVGRDLGVGAVLTGRLIQQGDNLTIRTELVNVAEGTELWGQQYNRKVADVFAVQEEIAKEISEKLRVKLTGTEQQQLTKRPTENIKAFQYYMQGRAYAQRRTREDLLTAIQYDEKALAEDQNYALAYTGLADAYVLLGARGYIAPIEGRRRGEEAARKALSLDENLAEAHTALGEAYTFFVPYNFSLGDRELRRAIELSPSSALAHFYLGNSFAFQGRLDESLEEQLKARELDPLSSTVARGVAIPYYLKRDYVRALELLRLANELGPAFGHTWEIGAYIQNGSFNQALTQLEKAKQERKSDPILIYSTGMVYAAQGKRAEALQVIKELEEMSGVSLSQAHWIAKIYATLNEKELALTWLEHGLVAGAIGIFYKDEPVWDPIRSDPRYAGLLKKMGLPSESDRGSRLPSVEKPKTEPSSKWQSSIAVLPFKNISADKEQEYFCDGMTEQLITNLSNLPNVKVIARTSVMQFKNTNKTVPQIANELGVAHVLEGSVRKAGNKIRVTAQLIKAEDGFHLWAKDYDRQLKDVFAVQDDVSNAIVEALKVKLTPSEKAAVTKRSTESAEAYELYLQGRFHLNKRSTQGFQRAISFFTQATKVDPRFARAYSGLADSYSLLGFFGFGGISAPESIEKGRSAAQKAIQLDPMLAEAHASLAFVKMRYDWDWDAAEKEYRRAIELNPQYETAHHWYSVMLISTARSEEGLVEIKKAQQLDPVSPIIRTVAGLHFHYLHQYDKAIEVWRETLDLDPNFAIAHLNLGRAYEQKKMFGEAIRNIQKAATISGNSAFYVGALGHAYAAAGQREKALAILEQLMSQSARGYISYHIAEILLALGDKDAALAWLEKAYEERSGWLIYLKVEPKLDPLRTDTRFVQFLKKLGLEK